MAARPFKFRRFLLHALAASLAFSSAAALATPITDPSQLLGSTTLINFNSLAAGTITGPLTLSGVTFTGDLSAKSSAGYGAPVTYPNFVSGIALGVAHIPGGPIFTITFANLVSEVGFGLWDPNFNGNLISAFDAAGNLLETTAPNALFPVGGTGADYVGFLRGAADIKRIEIVAGSQNNVPDGIWIDNLAFGTTVAASTNTIPVPGSLILVLTGLAAGAAVRRRAA